jgi:tetratricopeptide (TPR) repeat protein
MKRVLLAALVLVIFGACNPKQSKLRNTIAEQEKNLLEKAKSNQIDTTAVNSLLAEYEAYAQKYPDDTMGAEYLFKAADFYRYMHKPLRSIELYSKVYEQYPSVSRRPYALFLQGFIFENEAGNNHAAKVLYEKFLKQYPDHPISKDVRITLANLGKSPEQLLREFQEKAKQDSVVQVQK